MRTTTKVSKHTLFLFAALLPLASPGGAQIPWVGLTGSRARLVAETGATPDGPTAGDQFGYAVASGDFNGDGVGDLVVGIPGNNCASNGQPLLDCGMVMVRYGQTGVGLGSTQEFLDLSAPGSVDEPIQADRLGAAVAAGDFNNDGFSDLAIGVPMSSQGHGRVVVHYGGPGGITPNAIHLFEPGVTANLPNGDGGLASMRSFGGSLAAGNFDGDSYDDLAIGVTGYSPSNQFNAGGVVVLSGGLGGLMATAATSYFIGQEHPDIPDQPEVNDSFGQALASGDFNGDQFDDLAIGAPNEDGVGAILVIFGSPNSLIFANNYWLGELDLGSSAESGDYFGWSLAVGDFNGDDFADLAVGVPGQNDGDGDFDIGMFGVLYGAPGSATSSPQGGFNFSATQWRWEELLGGSSEDSDRLGASLATGDFDRDGFDDLAIGVPGEALPIIRNGAVWVVSGSAALLSDRARRFIAGVEGLPPLLPNQIGGAGFGTTLTAGDFDADGAADLVTGLPDMEFLSESDGCGFVLYGSTALFEDGFETASSLAWSATAP